VQDWLIQDDGTGPEWSAQFDLHLFINLIGNLFRQIELKQMPQQSGFTYLQTIHSGGIYDVMLAEKAG
jgi:hypothetical protein